MRTKFDLNILLGKPVLLWQKFHEKTKIKKRFKDIPIKSWPESWKTIYFKSYPRFAEIILPKPNLSNKISFKKVLSSRISSRKFGNIPLDINQLSNLLFHSAGLKDKLNPYSGRFYPSAGGRYPLEVYLLSLNTDIPRGLYHYYLKNHSLEELMFIDKFNLKKILLPKKWVKNAACLIIITAVFERNTVKYGERGYRHVLIESGLLLQNFYLNASALSINCCAYGGYFDDPINQLLDIDGINESVVNVLLLGNP